MMLAGKPHPRLSSTYFIALFLSVCASLLLLDLSVRYRLITPRFQMMGVDIVLDAELLFRIQPNSRNDIDARGFRVSRLGRAEAGPGGILMLGDSFVFGPNVGAEEALPAQLEREMGGAVSVLNMGVMGYGPDQELLQLKRWAPLLKPSALVLVLFPANDFRDLAVNHLFRIEHGALVRVHDAENPGNLPGFRLACALDYVVYRLTGTTIFFWKLFETYFADKVPSWEAVDLGNFEGHNTLALMEHVLQEFKGEAERLGTPLVVVLLPSIEWATESREEKGSPDQFGSEMLRICRQASLQCLSMYEAFAADGNPAQFFDPLDRHLSVRGYESTGRRIAQELRRLH